jgi:hypothetical protein
VGRRDIVWVVGEVGVVRDAVREVCMESGESGFVEAADVADVVRVRRLKLVGEVAGAKAIS